MPSERFAQSLLLLVCTAAVFAGCNMPGFTVQATPQPTSDSLTAVTVPPALTIAPTQDAPPSQLVEQGERDLHNGNWEAAINEFQQVLLNPLATEQELVRAKLGLGHAALRQGSFDDARSTLDVFLTSHPDHPLASSAYFLRGEARLGLSDWTGAIADFQMYLQLRPGLIDSYVYERIADANLALGQTDIAIQFYEQAAGAERNLVSGLALRERIATVQRSIGNADGAVAQYDAILALAQNDVYRAAIEFQAGQSLLEAGRTEEAGERFMRVFMNYPASRQAFDSLVFLRDNGYQLEPFTRGLVNYNQGEYANAIPFFLDYVATSGLDYPPDVHLYLGICYREIGNAPAALTELQALIGRFEPADGTAWGDAWLEIAAIHAKAGDNAAAFETYNTLIEEYPTLPQVPDALHGAGFLAESLNDFDLAKRYYVQLATSFGDPRAAEGLQRLGISAYRAENLPDAITYFGDAATSPGAQRPGESYYWLGKSNQLAGQTDLAADAFNQTVQAESGVGYFALRATDQLAGGRGPFVSTGPFVPSYDGDAGRQEAEQWLVTRFGLEVSPPLADSLSTTLTGDPRFVRGSELWSLGLLAEGKADLEAVRTSHIDDPLISYQLAIYFRDIGLYRSSILAASRIMRLADISNPLEAPLFLARLAYPVYFSDLVIDEAGTHNLDPAYVFALIRQESLFEGFAVSSASAQGLMQIWPPTGADIANRLAWPDYRVSDLQRPYISVKFGTWLLREELNRFDQDAQAALAAYNAGPGNTATWRTEAGGDPDLFVEVMTLNEPKLYVTLIYEHYHIYQQLYSRSETGVTSSS